MKISISFGVAALAALGCAQQQQQPPPRCSGNIVRRNAATLSSSEWQSIGDVLRRMNNDGWLARFAAAHDRRFGEIHGNSMFFPYHRRFLIEFERVARTYDSSFSIPYWDATQSAGNPANDMMLSPGILGRNGRDGDRCLQDGIQGRTQLTYPDQHCLRRNFNGGQPANVPGQLINTWYDARIIEDYVRNRGSLSLYREQIEYSIHGAVHLGLSGDMDSRYAAHDFSFMVHHANIDRLWWRWQAMHGTYLTSDGLPSLNSQFPQDQDRAFTYNGDSIGSVMVLGYGGACYTYASEAGVPNSHPSSGSRVTRRSNSSSSSSNKKSCPAHKLDKPVPYPSRLTPEWVKMHGFDPVRVEQFHAQACAIAEAYNNGTYVVNY